MNKKTKIIGVIVVSVVLGVYFRVCKRKSR